MLTQRVSQLIATVLSESSPQQGQKARSSSNFSIIKPPQGTKKIEFHVYDLSDSDEDVSHRISFTIAREVRGKDKIIFNSVYDGFDTNYVDLVNCYISQPWGTKGPFKVEVYATI
ncbi:TPA: DeoR family transcriptional regulator [Bacillus cereus]|nr:DeoR family transcriptional regulator [Bacillus cereus]HDR3914494.1 DeoR family transcriptional regulator [Bacillus cereus]HDV7172614.1 DeoR family transcriptional regulator [Bacillus cereus]